jgi:hypothetical protein
LDRLARDVENDARGDRLGIFSSPIIVSVTVPLHASVSVVSAACAVTDPTVIITMEAMMHEHVRSISRKSSRGMIVPH